VRNSATLYARSSGVKDVASNVEPRMQPDRCACVQKIAAVKYTYTEICVDANICVSRDQRANMTIPAGPAV
jgi:hypothetical protein